MAGMDWWSVVTALVLHLGPDGQWARVLTGLDHARSQAFATGDPSRLADVYVPGGEAVDAATIAAYERRGGRVVGVMTLESVRVVREIDDRVRLDVVDRLARARVEWADGTVTDLPRDRPTRREVVLHRTDDGWRIAESRVRRP